MDYNNRDLPPGPQPDADLDDNSASLNRLLLLHKITTVMQGTLDLRHLFHVLLSACTAGEGLGFNRAFLFLIDRRANVLAGRLAVGPDSHEDAGWIWGTVGQRTLSTDQFIDSLEVGEDFFEETELARRTRDIRIPIVRESGVIANTVLDQRPQLVQDAKDHTMVNRQLLRTFELEHFASFPLVAKGEVEGVIVVDNKFNQRPITDDDMLLLEVLASQAAVAIRNARLYEQVEQLNEDLEERVREATADLERRLKQLGLLHEINVAVLSQRNPAELLYLVVERALELCNATSGAIMLLDEEQRSLQVEASRAATDAVNAQEMLQVGQWVAQEVAIRGEPKSVDSKDLLGQHLFCSILAAPMKYQQRANGVIYVCRPAPTRFEEADLEVLTMLANVASLVLHNARMYQDVERRFREVASLSEVQQAIVSSFDLERLLELITQRAVEVVPGADACVISLRDEKSARLAKAASCVHPNAGRPADAPAEEEITITPPTLEIVESSQLLDGYRIICVPLIAKTQVIGVMDVYWREAAYDPREEETMRGFAGQAATAIQNVRLYQNLVQSYRELKNTQNALTQKEKLAVLGEMAATVAHEIRNPLTAIRGYSQRIGAMVEPVMDEDRVERIRKYSGVVVNEVDRLNDVVCDVLNFARRGTQATQTVNVNDLLRDVLHLEEIGTSSSNLLISTDLGQDLPPVRCDPNQIKQVIINLVQNAIQVLSNGGVLHMETFADDNRVYLKIRDTGPGIPPDHLEKIFQPFYTTRTTGTGLGLSLAKRVVEEDHRGNLTVESKLNEGTTFTIALPLHASEPQNEEYTP